MAVDDQEFNLIPLGIFLKKQFEITVTKSKDGSYALQTFKDLAEKPCCKKSYRLIIMDINMPIMDGVTATRKILEYCD